MRKTSLLGLCCLMTLFWACLRPPASLEFVPENLSSIEGHASLKISSEGESARSRFSFVFSLPDRGWIDVSTLLGGTMYRILIDREEAFFILPSKKVYWQGPEEEIIDKFLGFPLELEEMISLVCGRWTDGRASHPGADAWVLERDGKGRILSGRREQLSFWIKEFIDKTAFTRILEFKHPYSEGQIKVLGIRVNGPIKESTFSRDFLHRFARKTWSEIQEILHD